MNHSTPSQSIKIHAFVEGPGDRLALPILLKKYHDDVVCKEIEPKNGTVDEKACIRWLQRTVRNLDASTVLLILRDASHPTDPKHECALVTTNKLVRLVEKELKTLRVSVPVGIVVAKWEYEAWLIASIETIANNLGWNANAKCNQHPEEVEDPKKWIERHAMRRSNPNKHPKYIETCHQPQMTKHLDFTKASECPSFKRLLKALDEIIKMVKDRKEYYVTPQLNDDQFPCCH